jgi:hypothetical protein
MLSYPAIAEHDERHRRKGEPLFPELKPLDFLLDRKRMLTQPSWESIYQQHPIIVGGGQFPIEKLRVLPFFDQSKITHTIRYWDKASSDTEDAAFTAGVLMHAMSDGSFVISHVARGQWTALEREQKIRVWTEADAAQYSNYEIWVEQEPGSGGKEVTEDKRSESGMSMLAIGWVRAMNEEEALSLARTRFAPEPNDLRLEVEETKGESWVSRSRGYFPTIFGCFTPTMTAADQYGGGRAGHRPVRRAGRPM